MADEPWFNPYDPERIAKAAAETVTTTAFYAYHPAERKARARESLRIVIDAGFRRDKDDGTLDVWLEGLWNTLCGHNDD